MTTIAAILAQWKLIIIGILTALVCAQYVRIASLQNDRNERRAVLAESARMADRAQREVEQTWQQRLATEREHGHKQTLAYEAAVQRASGVERELRTARADATRRARAQTCAGPRSEAKPDFDAISVLADVHGWTDSVSGVYARLSDKRKIVGDMCERSFDATR